mmetsp:Transcript_23815/g.81397  ORF Transcript_23815/g.81397 Transcript_23815/m.81397 type:complete len:289 (+) Transcript_23815:2416-3282(+)
MSLRIKLLDQGVWRRASQLSLPAARADAAALRRSRSGPRCRHRGVHTRTSFPRPPAAGLDAEALARHDVEGARGVRRARARRRFGLWRHDAPRRDRLLLRRRLGRVVLVVLGEGLVEAPLVLVLDPRVVHQPRVCGGGGARILARGLGLGPPSDRGRLGGEAHDGVAVEVVVGRVAASIDEAAVIKVVETRRRAVVRRPGPVGGVALRLRLRRGLGRHGLARGRLLRRRDRFLVVRRRWPAVLRGPRRGAFLRRGLLRRRVGAVVGVGVEGCGDALERRGVVVALPEP